MNDFQTSKKTFFQDNYGNKYSYEDLLNMNFEQLEALENGQSISTLQNSKTLEKSNTQEKGWQKTLDKHPLAKKVNNTKTTITTILLAFCLLLSGFMALYINLLA